MRAAIITASCLALTLTACAGSPRPSRAVLDRIDRVLVGAPGEAQPGKIVSTELAYARMSREDGHWDAAREFAAPGAKIHGPNGPVDAEAIFKVIPEPTLKWDVRNVWMSCDATMAISSGRYVDGEGKVGSYATVWERQPDLEYRWVYDLAIPDDPQPEPDPERPAGENEIIVTAAESIQGRVADCLPEGEAIASAELMPDEGIKAGDGRSRDATLSYVWEHNPDGTRKLVVGWWRENMWQEALRFPVARAKDK